MLFDALSEKVAEVHRSCVGDRMTNLDTLEKLTNLENHISLLLLSLESIPKEILEMIKKIKDSEKRSRYTMSQSLCFTCFLLTAKQINTTTDVKGQ